MPPLLPGAKPITARDDEPHEEAKTIAFIGLATMGSARQEILEIGVIVVDAASLAISKQRLVRAECPFEADALAVYGAVPLREALELIAPLLEDALLASHNVGFDWKLLETGFCRVGLPVPKVTDYLDTMSLAWPLLARRGTIDSVCHELGIEPPRPHLAMAHARSAYEVVQRVVDKTKIARRIASLPEDEREIAETLIHRLEEGRTHDGTWRVNDGRDYLKETELLDGLHYIALVRRRRQNNARRRHRVYVCHPFAHDPLGNIDRVRVISRELVDEGVLPVAPHLYLPQFVDETTDRETALTLCLELVATCDEVRVFSDAVTDGMEREIREAKRLGIPVHFARGVRS